MTQTHPLYRFTSLLLSVLLLLQSIAPALAYAPRAVAQETPLVQPTADLLALAQPADLTHPLTIARVQSTYQAGGTAVITYTIRNNQSAHALPQLQTGLNITDTVAALAGFDPLADPNTLHNLIVRHDFSNATLLDASVWPTSAGNIHLFQVGTLAPRAETTFTLTVQLPATAANFTTLGQATAYGTLHGREITATAHPIRLAPSGFAQWLTPTPDVALQDTAMLMQTAELGDDPLAFFDYVQQFGYHAYQGSLRGTRGTLWSEAGNSVDQSSLLIAMLRSAGYPARYRQGTLPTAEARALLASMFPASPTVRGTIPAGTETSDPLNDPALLALAQAHWWVEAYLPNTGWTTLDPTVGTNGSTPATPSGAATAELPAELRHMLHLALEVEKYNSFPLGGLNLQTSTVLTASLPSAETTGAPINLGFAVSTDTQGGLTFVNIIHNYTPYLNYGTADATIIGTPVQDLLTNFPLATHFTTGVWLNITTTAPDGRTETHRRMIKDLIGADGRQGGAVQLPPRDDSPLLSASDLIQVQPMANSGYPAAELDRIIHSMFHQLPHMVELFAEYNDLTQSTNPAAVADFASQQLPTLFEAQFTQLSFINALFQYGSTGPQRPLGADTLLVTSYPDRPKLLLSSQVSVGDGSLHTSFELLSIAEKAIATPGQNSQAVGTANYLRTTSEKTLEYEILTLFGAGEVHSAVRTLLVAAEQNIPTRIITTNNLFELDELAIPSLTKAHITEYAQQGAMIWVPEQMVTLPYGEDIGFMAVMPDGTAVYVNAEGHMAAAALFYALQNQNVIVVALIQGGGLGFVGGFLAYIFTFFAEAFLVLINFPPVKPGDLPGFGAGEASGKSTFIGLVLAAKAALPLPLAACTASPNPPACQGGVAAGYLSVVSALVAGLVGGGLDPSLPNFWVADVPQLAPAPLYVITRTQPANLPAGTVTLNLPASHHWAQSAAFSTNWTSNGQQIAQFESLTSDLGRPLPKRNPPRHRLPHRPARHSPVGGQRPRMGTHGRPQPSQLRCGQHRLGPRPVGRLHRHRQRKLPPHHPIAHPASHPQQQYPVDGRLNGRLQQPPHPAGHGHPPLAPLRHHPQLHPQRWPAHAFGPRQWHAHRRRHGRHQHPNPRPRQLQRPRLPHLGRTPDQISLSGSAQFFTLRLTSDSTTLSAHQSTRLLPQIQANTSDSYRITAYAPAGWEVGLDLTGQLVVTPTATAAVGSATLFVTAQSTQNPILFASATHAITVLASSGVAVDVALDPVLTVPMGVIQDPTAATPLTLNHIANGRAEIPNAACNVQIRNKGNAPATFNISVAVGDRLGQWQHHHSLPSGAQNHPPLRRAPAGTLPPAGTNFPFTVTAVTPPQREPTRPRPPLHHARPALPLSHGRPAPATVTPGEPVTISLRVQNVGNVAASFPITATVRDRHFSTAVVSPNPLTSPPVFNTGTLAPNASFETNLLLDTSAATPGTTYFVQAATVAGEYEPLAISAVQIASLLTAPLLETAACLIEPMSTATTHLGQTIMAAELTCGTGNCSPTARAELLNAIDSYLATTNRAGFPVDTSAVMAARATVANANTTAELLDALPPLVAAVLPINQAACTYNQHRVSGRFTPYVAAILLGETAEFSLDVTNHGTLATTYAITVAGLPTGDVTFNETIPPGTTVSLPVASTPANLGTFDLLATMTAVVPSANLTVESTAVGRLNVVDKFVQITQVTADPPFVETGTSATNLSVEVANVAGVGIPANGRTQIFAPNGAEMFTADIPLNLLAGTPRIYDLTEVNTSGWAEGVYTVTVHLLNAQDQLIPDGSGYGYFAVGQALQLSQAVTPELVPPGTFTVTTLITSEISAVSGQLSAVSPSIYTAAPAGTGLLPALNGAEEQKSGGAEDAPAPVLGHPQELPLQDDQSAIPNPQSPILPLTPFYTDTLASPSDSFPIPHSPFTIQNSPAFTRLEQDDPAISYSGTWSNVNLTQASGGSYWSNNVAGSTAEFSFDGTWFNLGLVGDWRSGYAQLHVDGIDYGILDLYRHDLTPFSLFYDGLPSGTHTVTLTVLGTGNPLGNNVHIRFDYADFGDGSALPAGDFEQDDPRWRLSDGWSTTNYAPASGGSYMHSTNSTAWFPFTGESFRLQALAYSSANKVQLFVDGVYLDTIELFHPVFAGSAVTRTFAYTGFTPGPHILQVMSYQNAATIDKISTPATGPFIDPNPPLTGISRFEADHPALRYNGLPLTQTAQSWTYTANIFAYRASDGEYAFSATANDTIALTFDGDWVGVGFASDTQGGLADIAIDGQFVQTVDLYSRYDDTVSVYFDGLGAGTHTITVTVQGDSHPNSTGDRVYFDFFDVWDGQPLAEGTFEEDNGRLFYAVNWDSVQQAAASNGAYGVSGLNVNTTVWFPFTGDSVSYQAWASDDYDEVEIRLDGVSQGQFPLYSVTPTTRTFSFDGLGSGPHVLEVRVYRDNATVDAFITPAVGPATEPPVSAPIFRYEEDHPAMRYSGHPFRQMPQNWGIQANWQSSGSHNTTTSVVGNSWSLDFEGEWVNLGFHSPASAGAAEIFIDGVSQGIFQTIGGVNDVISFPFGDLGAGPHTVSAVVISGTVRPDYIDVWDGQPIPEGWYNADLDDLDGLFNFSWKNWWLRSPNHYAHGEDYLSTFVSAHNNIWFSFVGTDLTVLGFNRINSDLQVVIDGVDYGQFDMTAEFSDQPFALHFPDLGAGAHTVQVYVPSTARIDAFHVNPPGFYPYTPVVEWYDYTAQESLPPLPGTGFASSIALGDINNDGVVELIAPGVNGRLYVYRGDGQDAGGGTPILWTTDLVGPAAEPALADLDNDGTAEIILSGQNGTFAFRHDGTVLWHNPTVISYYPAESFGWGGPTVGNLDLDPEPEIAIAASTDAVYVLDHEGNILWSDPVGIWPTVPVLADITGDGILDVIVGQEWEITVYDFFNGGQVAWTYVQTDTHIVLGGNPGAFGAPAVADLDEDGQPEIIINWGRIIQALKADGTELWRYNTNNNSLYRPSPVTVADVTGDGRPNLITASAVNAGFIVFDHLMMVFDAEGNLLWDAIVKDNTASASGVAVQDLNSDGVWEILWNGAVDGFLVLRGSDGRRLFNEPATKSGTVLDYPTLGDVDGDGHAEVVVAGQDGLFVIGHDGIWGDSRPLWNQHNYHITNINDDWSVPLSEQNSWELHNTYRTQTPNRTPSPSYQLAFTYTEGTPDVSVLTATATISLTANPPVYTWDYRQEWYAPLITTTFDSLLTNLQPGEVRQVSAGTEVTYRLPSGENLLTLPPLYVTVANLGTLEPAEQTAAVGGTAVYTLTLTNPSENAAVYQVAVGGMPPAWLAYAPTVPLAAGQTTAVPITVTVPTTAAPDSLPLWVDVDNGAGGSESFAAVLHVVDGLAVSLTPASQTGPTGQPLAYALVVTNLEPVGREYALTADGLAAVTLPPTVVVAAGEVVSISLTAVPTQQGLQPFTIAVDSSGGSGSVDGLAIGQGGQDLALAIAPATQMTGPGVTSFYTVTLANVGDIPHTAALSVAVPVGWGGTLVQNGQPVGDVTLPPHIFNTAEMQLVVEVANNAPQGSYPITVTAEANGQQVVAVATAVVGQRGVGVEFIGGPATLDPRNSGTWQVRVTNHGALADVYDLELGGLAAVGGSLSVNVVSLAPGASQTVQLVLDGLDPLVPQSYALSVAAVSRASALIADEDTTAVTLLGYEAVQVGWFPASQTVTGTLSAQVMLFITNTGNSNATFDLGTTVAGGGSTASINQIILPAQSTAQVLVTVMAPQAGTYSVVGTAASVASPTSASGQATVVFAAVETADPVIYLPLIMRQP